MASGVSPFFLVFLFAVCGLVVGAVYKYYIRPRLQQRALRRRILREAAAGRERGGIVLPNAVEVHLQRICQSHAGSLEDPMPAFPLLNQVGRYSDDDSLEEENGRARRGEMEEGEGESGGGRFTQGEEMQEVRGEGDRSSHRQNERTTFSRSVRALFPYRLADPSHPRAPIGSEEDQEVGHRNALAAQERVGEAGRSEVEDRAHEVRERGTSGSVGVEPMSGRNPPEAEPEGVNQRREEEEGDEEERRRQQDRRTPLLPRHRHRRHERPRLIDFPSALPPLSPEYSGFGNSNRVVEVEEEYFLSHPENIRSYRDAMGFVRKGGGLAASEGPPAKREKGDHQHPFAQRRVVQLRSPSEVYGLAVYTTKPAGGPNHPLPSPLLFRKGEEEKEEGHGGGVLSSFSTSVKSKNKTKGEEGLVGQKLLPTSSSTGEKHVAVEFGMSGEV